MYPRPATPNGHPTSGRAFARRCVLILLASLLIFPPFVAGASGTVSLTIRVEVDPSDLLRGGLPGDHDGIGRADMVLARYEPLLRDSLKHRYGPGEIDRIVADVVNRAVIVVDGEALAASSVSDVCLRQRNGSVYVL